MDKKKVEELESEKEDLQSLIGQQTMEINFLKKKLEKVEHRLKVTMGSKGEVISFTRQCDLLCINRSRIYYEPRTKSEEDLIIIMRLIDVLYQKNPCMGSKMTSKEISKTHDIKLGRLKTRRLMREMCISAI